MNTVFDFNEQDRMCRLEVTVSKSLQELRFSAHYKGYRFLRVALMCTVEDQTMTDQMAQRLYVKIAEECDSKVPNVARAIRNAIKNTWAVVPPDAAKKYFGYYDPNDFPCNKKFIATVADYIRLRIK